MTRKKQDGKADRSAPKRSPVNPRYRARVREIVLAWVAAFKAVRATVAALETLDGLVYECPHEGGLEYLAFDSEGAETMAEECPHLLWEAQRLLTALEFYGHTPPVVSAMVWDRDRPPCAIVLRDMRELGIEPAEAGA